MRAGRLGFNVRRTMGVAQRLYEGRGDRRREGTVGLITYMRTDSTRASDDAMQQAREYVQGTLGAKYLPKEAIDYKGKKDAQDAHEAIRPTNVSYTPESIRQYLSDEQYKLYELIWQEVRLVADVARGLRPDDDRDRGEGGPRRMTSGSADRS